MVLISKSGRLPFEAFFVPEKYASKAEEQLFETEENRSAALEQLKQFISEEKDLRCETTDDDFLLMFLRARKFNINRALSLLKKYTAFKKKNAQIFTNMNYEALAEVVETKTMGWLPERDEDGCVVLLVHLNNWNPSKVGIEDLKKCIVLFLFHSITDPLTQINGYKVIFDVKSHPLKHLRFATPYNLYLLYSGTQECFPGRFKGIHVVNMSATFRTAWAIVTPFLSEKLKSRIKFHPDNSSLHKDFPVDTLPIDFDGQLKRENDTISWLKNALKDEQFHNVLHSHS